MTIPSNDDWRVLLRLPGYAKDLAGGATRFRRSDLTAGRVHLLLHLLYLVAGVGVLCGARVEGALMMIVVWVGLVAAGVLDVMDQGMRRRTAHRPVRRALAIDAGTGEGRLTIDGALVPREQLRDVVIAYQATFFEGSRALSEERLRGLPRQRSAGLPGISPVTSRFALTVVTADVAHEVAIFDDADEALGQARALKQGLGIGTARGEPVRAFVIMPFSARTRIGKPLLWMLPDTLLMLVVPVLASTPAPLALLAVGCVSTLVVHDLLLVGLALSQRRDAAETGQQVLFELRGELGRTGR